MVWLSSPPRAVKASGAATLFFLCSSGPVFLPRWHYSGTPSISIKLDAIRCTALSHAARRAANRFKMASCGTCHLSSLVYKRGITSSNYFTGLLSGSDGEGERHSGGPQEVLSKYSIMSLLLLFPPNGPNLKQVFFLFLWLGKSLPTASFHEGNTQEDRAQ